MKQFLVPEVLRQRNFQRAGHGALSRRRNFQSAGYGALAALFLVAGLAACGSDSPTAPTTTPTTPTTPATDSNDQTATLSSIQSEIFNASCIGHHGDHATEGDLDLTDGMSYAELVNVPSVQAPSLDLVEPNDPENSYLIHKLEGRTGIVGDRMPPSGAITTEQIDTIRQWINAGAQNN